MLLLILTWASKSSRKKTMSNNNDKKNKEELQNSLEFLKKIMNEEEMRMLSSPELIQLRNAIIGAFAQVEMFAQVGKQLALTPPMNEKFNLMDLLTLQLKAIEEVTRQCETHIIDYTLVKKGIIAKETLDTITPSLLKPLQGEERARRSKAEPPAPSAASTASQDSSEPPIPPDVVEQADNILSKAGFSPAINPVRQKTKK